jgi:GT2 family glycosyltransferase
MGDMQETTNSNSAGPEPTLSYEQFQWTAGWHIPPSLKRALPRPIIDGLQALKGRILTRDFPRDTVFEQSPEDALASGSLSIVVPIHDAPAVTRRCLASLEQYAPRAEIVLVDDGSRLVETEALIRKFVGRNGWKFIIHENPLGHSMACGAGAGLATRPYLCLLNSDTVVTPWCWRLVKTVFESEENIVIAGPSTSNSGNVQTLPDAGYLRRYLNDNQICEFAKRLLKECRDPIVSDLPWISGFAFFIRRDIWNQLGGFDRNLPDYGNEVELCQLVEARGNRKVWIRNAYIHHFGRQSYGEAIGEEAIHSRIQAARARLKHEAD